jgi:toxin-antitoxin system PIN domain toxin
VSAFLADGNLLVALTVIDHVHHETALEWFEAMEPDLATCPITEGTLLRFLIREGHRATDATAVLDAVRGNAWHQFWPDVIPYGREHLVGVIGHRQVTDAYLVALARHNRGKVATLDKGLVALHGDHTHLVSV